MRRTWSRAVSIALLLALGATGIDALAQNAGQQQEGSTTAAVAASDLPDSPGSLVAQSNAPPQTSPSSNPSTQQQQQQQQSEPSGTAVAPQPQVSGGAASKPAGAAIAPPKQRRTRSLLIKLGFIAGAGAALGTVVALSAASPGRVPGSH